MRACARACVCPFADRAVELVDRVQEDLGPHYQVRSSMRARVRLFVRTHIYHRSLRVLTSCGARKASGD